MIDPFNRIKVDFAGKGVVYTATKNSTTDHDLLLTSDYLLNGGSICVDKAVVGDTITCQVLDNALTVKKEWITDWPICPGEPIEIITEQAAEIPANYYLRIKYTSIGTVDDVKVLIGYRLHKVVTS
jgi:hypothetical protein